MTDEDLHRILTDLTAHLKQMRGDRLNSAFPASSGSNAGIRAQGSKPKLPCSADLLNWEAELHFELSEPAEELHSDYPADCWPTPRMDPSRGTDSVAWAQWLNHPRHRPLILAKDWDLPDWLANKESELRHMLHPTDPHGQKAGLPTFATAAELSAHFGLSEKVIKRWCDRNEITHWTGPDGKNIYPTAKVLEKRNTSEES